VWCPRHTIQLQFFNHGYTEYSEKALELLDISISSLEWKDFMLKQGLWLKVRRLPGKVKGTGIATSYLICYRNRKIREDSMPIYEYKATEGMWSHAAELADKTGLEDRAKEDYKRAGHEI